MNAFGGSSVRLFESTSQRNARTLEHPNCRTVLQADMIPIDPSQVRRILIRQVNWVGDAVLTLPAV